MVFDNCKIDVFFHMRSHYNRLKNVQSVVDCCPPKALKRISLSETSFQHVEMAHLPTHSYGTKKHNCEYSHMTDLVTAEIHTPSSKTKRPTARPKTRRHPEDSPHVMPAKQSRYSGDRSSRLCSKYTSTSTGYSYRTNKFKNNELYLKNLNSSTGTMVHVPCSSGRSSCPSTMRTVHLDKEPPQEKPRLLSPLVHLEGEKFAFRCITPMKDANASLEEQEYLQFLLRITEDIIRNDLYSNKEMKKVFTSHVKANSNRLELDRMLLRIYELMKELNIPLGLETHENDTASWTDIETTMRGLLSLENTKSQENPRQQNENINKKPSTKEKCICFDLRATYPIQNDKNDVIEEEMDNLNFDDKFRTSLDRLTEHTEPLSSRPTCKVSTSFSNFGDVEVLPGFECLETPKVSTGVLCELYSRRNPVSRTIRTVCHCHSVNKKLKVQKRKVKRRKKLNRKKNIGEVKTDNRVAINTKNCETEAIQCEIPISNYNEKPIIIAPQECEGKKVNVQDDTNDPSKQSRNDYILIEGPIYLLKTFLHDNPEIVIRNEAPSTIKTTVPSKVSFHSIEPISYYPEEKTQVENEVEDVEIIEGKSEQERSEEIKYILHELTNFSMSVTPSEDQTFEFINRDDGCGRFGDSEVDATGQICRIVCPHKAICNKFRLATSDATKERNFWTDEYDLTPEKDYQEVIPNYSILSPVISPIVIQDFLTTREIQTEDIAHNPTTVGVALISFDEASDSDLPKDLNVDSQQSDLSISATKAKKNIMEQITPPANDYFEFEKEMTEPTNYNILLMASKHIENSQDPHLKSTDHTDGKQPSLDSKVPVVSSYQTNGTLTTLASTATVERTKQFLEIEEEMNRKTVSPLFSVLTDYPEISKDDSGDIKHQRKVSILKNPVVQVPIEKIFTENDENKRKGESIIRTVESLKDRQSTRDPYLDKVLQDIESSRETRAPEKITSTEVSEKSEHFALPGPSALKNSGRYGRDEDENDSGSSSLDDLSTKIKSIGHRDMMTGTAGMPTNSGVSSEAASEQNFLSHLDEQAEVRGTASQIKQINTVTAKLDQLRHSNDRDETAISTTLDKLVETLKEQQEKEEEVLVKSEEPEEKKSVNSHKKNPISCCGFCKKKKRAPAIPFNEPHQSNTFSEQDYKAKSEAFELALASLGQKRKSTEMEEMQVKVPKSTDEVEGKGIEYSGPSPIFHSGNRLSLVRIADERENDMAVLNADFEVISTKISNDRIR